jgi:hypothetical protein
LQAQVFPSVATSPIYSYEYGQTVAISEDGTLFVVSDASSASGSTGVVYTYKFSDANNWVQQGTVPFQANASTLSFGLAIALSLNGSSMIVGAPGYVGRRGAFWYMEHM